MTSDDVLSLSTSIFIVKLERKRSFWNVWRSQSRGLFTWKMGVFDDPVVALGQADTFNSASKTQLSLVYGPQTP